MGYARLSFENRAAVLGIASMAYGTGAFEGTKGGKGHIGLLNVDGGERVVTFDTNGGTSRDANAVLGADRLRAKLLTLARDAGLAPGTLREIRRHLGLAEGEERLRFASLLDRKVVAKVVTLICGDAVWSAVKAGRYETPALSMGIPDARQLQTVKRNAEAQLALFRNAIRTGIKYVKWNTREGRPEDAGGRNVLRDAMAERENNHVRSVLYNAVLLHYDGRIPPDVLAQMTNFTHKGNPLSTERLTRIFDAMDRHDGSAGGDVGDVNDVEVPDGNAAGDRPPVSGREISTRKQHLVDRLADEVWATLQKSSSGQTRDNLKKAFGKTRPAIRQSIVRMLEGNLATASSGGLQIGDLSALGKNFALTDPKVGLDLIGEELKGMYREAIDRNEGQVGFYKDLLRVMTSPEQLKKRTVNGRTVEPGKAQVSAFRGHSSVGTTEPNARNVDYGLPSAPGDHRQRISRDTEAFFAKLEQEVPDRRMRLFLTCIMGLTNPLSTLLLESEECRTAFGFDETILESFGGDGLLKTTQIVDDGSRQVDVSFVGEGTQRKAIVTERINVTPMLDVPLGNQIPLMDNWYKITTVVDLDQTLEDGKAPQFSQTIERPALPKAKQAAIDVFNEFVAFADRQGGSGKSYVKVFDDADLDSGRVRLGATQGEEKYSGRGEREKATNDTARRTFYSAVERMFDGQVPPEVRREMTNADYKGRPLSAARIEKIREKVVAAMR